MVDAAKVRVCTVVDIDVPDWSGCRDTALPLRLAPTEKVLAVPLAGLAMAPPPGVLRKRSF